MSASRQFTRHELLDPWVRFYEIRPPSGGPVPFPSSRNIAEVDRAARAIASGRSPGVQGWLNKRVVELARLGVERSVARRDVADLKAAIEARVAVLRGAHA
ncbi:DUF6074 family protein [Rhizobium leguminosarum]|uniref:DUF6074 family protein n=1 Tax=Rhizobium leguminosarum TaxID=384 RepID=UPI001030CB48|nr:DUF6074 family protein [Rhizobium leguminosarum]TBG03777.1 hypothetical protein ELG82_09600 [Rhizobium leguminosarum]